MTIDRSTQFVVGERERGAQRRERTVRCALRQAHGAARGVEARPARGRIDAGRTARRSRRCSAGIRGRRLCDLVVRSQNVTVDFRRHSRQAHASSEQTLAAVRASLSACELQLTSETARAVAAEALHADAARLGADLRSQVRTRLFDFEFWNDDGSMNSAVGCREVGAQRSYHNCSGHQRTADGETRTGTTSEITTHSITHFKRCCSNRKVKAKIVEREQQATQLQSQLASANETIKSQSTQIDADRVRAEQLAADLTQAIAKGSRFVFSSLVIRPVVTLLFRACTQRLPSAQNCAPTLRRSRSRSSRSSPSSRPP